MLCKIGLEDLVLKRKKSLRTYTFMVPLAFMFGRALKIGLNELTVWILEGIRNPIIRNISNYFLELGNQLVI